MGKKKQHPMQKLVIVDDVVRFRKNLLVEYLLSAGPFDLNHLSCLPNIPKEDWEQFAQLIGYSVSGFGSLSYATDEVVAKSDAKADKLWKRHHAKKRRAI